MVGACQFYHPIRPTIGHLQDKTLSTSARRLNLFLSLAKLESNPCGGPLLDDLMILGAALSELGYSLPRSEYRFVVHIR